MIGSYNARVCAYTAIVWSVRVRLPCPPKNLQAQAGVVPRSCGDNRFTPTLNPDKVVPVWNLGWSPLPVALARCSSITVVSCA